MSDIKPTPDQPATRAEIYRIVADAVDRGLPAPQDLWFQPRDERSFTLNLDSIADRIAWQPVFGLQDATTSEQPYPEAAPFDRWVTTVYGSWRGWWVNLAGADPITEEHLERWVATDGHTTRVQAYLAFKAAQGGGSDV
jgi:hypothetical protein